MTSTDPGSRAFKSFLVMVAGSVASPLVIRSVIENALDRAGVPPEERSSKIAETLGRAGVTDFETRTTALSGGWRKRLAITGALVEEPDILLRVGSLTYIDGRRVGDDAAAENKNR